MQTADRGEQEAELDRRCGGHLCPGQPRVLVYSPGKAGLATPGVC